MSISPSELPGSGSALRVSIGDVARIAGVSRTSVSNFLNRPQRLSDATRERIAAVVDDLGFVPSDAARQLRSGRNTVIGHIAFEVSNSHFGAVADAIEVAAQAAGYTVLIGNSLGSEQREREYLRLFERQRVGGIIISPVGDVEAELAQMRRRGMPSVVGGTAIGADQPSVSVDEVEGGRLATRHLLETGRRRLAYVGGPIGLQQISSRFEGAVAAVRQIPNATLEMIATDHRTVADGRAVGQMLLARDPLQRPDGIFAANDLLAVGIMQTLALSGAVRIPDDVAIIGYDDSDFDQTALVPLSSIQTPHVALGKATVQLLVDPAYMTADGMGLHRIYQPELVARASTGSPYSGSDSQKDNAKLDAPA